MKFKFCGDNDCQDWLLAQISILSKLTSIKMKLILVEVIKHIVTGNLDFPKVCKLTADCKLNEDETKGVLAALNFILVSSCKHDTDSEVVLNELQQLGLPKEHTVALCKSYMDNFSKIQSALREQSLNYNAFNQCSYELQSNFVTTRKEENFTVHCPMVVLSLSGNQQSKPISTSFAVTPDKLDSMIGDLKEALQIMDNVHI